MPVFFRYTNSFFGRSRGPASQKWREQVGCRPGVEPLESRSLLTSLLLYNPPGSNYPIAQIDPGPLLKNNSNTTETIQLSVTPAGAATFATSSGTNSLTLAPGGVGSFSIIPQTDSKSVNDVHVTAIANGIALYDNLFTFYSATFPQDIRGVGLPSASSDSIPAGADTPITVNVTPNLAASGQALILSVSGQSTDNGTVTIDGKTTEQITSTTTVNLKGAGLTSSGHVGQLRFGFTANQAPSENSGPASLFSSGFSVTAIPTNLSLAWDVANGGIDFNYSLPDPLPFSVPFDLYWSPSKTLDLKNNTPAYSSLLEEGQSPAPIHVSASSISAPPANAKYLIAVLDPTNTVLLNGTPNSTSVAYDPEITVTSKYNGNSTSGTFGRFLAIPNVVTGETLTAQLSDSLAALRPVVSTWIGDQSLLLAHHKTTGIFGTWDGRTYETDPFDPGAYSGQTTLTTQALLGNGTDLFDVNDTLDVQPVPDWIKALTDKPAFTVIANTTDGSYQLSGFLQSLASATESLAIPASIPFIGGKTISASAGIRMFVSVDLNKTVVPIISGGVALQANVLGQTISESLDPTKIQVKPTVGLDPETLQPNGDFGVTISFSYNKTLTSSTLYSSDYLIEVPTTPPFLAELDIEFAPILNVSGTASVIITGPSGIQIVPDSTSLTVGVTGTVTGTAMAGFFVPSPFLRRELMQLLGISSLPSLSFSSSISGSVELHSKTTYVAGGTPLVTSWGGSISLNPIPVSSFTIGSKSYTNLFFINIFSINNKVNFAQFGN